MIKDLRKILKLADEVIKEENTKKYTLKPFQRNVVRTLSGGFVVDKEAIRNNLMKTKTTGYFEPTFNDEEDAKEFLNHLEMVVGKNKYYLKTVKVGTKNNIIPGFGFCGAPVKGQILETRLFRK